MTPGKPSGDVGDISSQIFNCVGARMFPLYAQPQMARGWFDLRNIVFLRSMEHVQWELDPRRGPPLEVRPSLGMYLSAAGGNLYRFRQR